MQTSCVNNNNIKSEECKLELLKEKRNKLQVHLKVLKRRIRMIDALLSEDQSK
jgi:hypothetical protein